MRILLGFLFFVFSSDVFGLDPQDFGYQHLKTSFKGDTVHILLKSKKGEELMTKPLLLFCQGSLPIPLIITQGKAHYPVFPFSTDHLIEKYHLVVIAKPHIPVMAEIEQLSNNFSYLDPETGKVPLLYLDMDHLEYYVNRNLAVMEFLWDQSFCDQKGIVVAGHSQGARIAAELALQSEKASHLIYAGGNPFGQIMTMIAQMRSRETDSTQYAEGIFNYWKEMVNDSTNTNNSDRESNRSTFGFSQPSMDTFNKLQIPVLVSYGTKDLSSLFNDYLRLEMIRDKKENFTFKSYIGLDHNFFGFKDSGEIDHKNKNWDLVAEDWMEWLDRE